MRDGVKRKVYTAEWVVPISSPPIRHGLVVVEGSKIAYVGRDIAEYYRQFDVLPNADGTFELAPVEGGYGLIIPGLVNTHTHLELTLMRGLLEGLPFREWLRLLTDARATVLDAEALLDSCVMGIHEGLLHGITTYADTTASGAPLSAMHTTGVRGIGYLEVFGPAASHADANQITRELALRLDAYRQQDSALITTGVSPHAPYTVSPELFRCVGALAREKRVPVAMHVAESAAESEFVQHGTGAFADGHRARGFTVEARGKSPVQHLKDTGILDDTGALLIHCVRIDEADAATIAASGAAIAHCPISNAKLGHGIAPLELMRDAGIRTGLGSDSVVSNNAMDILTEARVASLFQSVRRGAPDALSAVDALRMATLGGAEALGLAERVGSIEVGKDADLAMLSVAALDSLTVFDPAALLVHTLAGNASFQTVLVAGEERVREGRLVHVDSQLAVRVHAITAKLAAWRRSQPVR